MNFLVVEDTPSLRDALRTHLQSQGHSVDACADLASARGYWDAQSGRYDLVVLDVGLPDGSGTTLLAHIRASGDDTGVLVLTARSQVSDKVHLLDQGADDYMTKPFEFEELDARVRSIYRRQLKKPTLLEGIGPLELDRTNLTFWHEGQSLNLRQKEAQVLAAFVDASGHQCTKAYLMERLYSMDEAVTENAIEVHIGRLRRKLQPTVLG